MYEGKMYAFIIDPKKEQKIKTRIMQILRHKVKGQPNAVKQSHLHKMIGCSIRADYLGHLLETLQEDEKIMRDNSGLWSLWDSPRNIEQREWWEKCDRERREWEIEWANSPAGRAEREKKEAEAHKAAQDRFNKRLYQFLSGSEEALFDVIRRIYYEYQPKEIKHSMINY